MKTFFQLLTYGKTSLKKAGIKESRQESEILLLRSFVIPKVKLLAELQTNLLTLYSQKQYEKNYAKFKKHLYLRVKRIPMAYILGEAGFRSNNYFVAKKVFIPRPETELLVEKAIEIGQSLKFEEKEFVIFDVGCGTGIIGLELALAFPEAKVFLWEKSKKAYGIAQKNKVNLRIKNAEIRNYDFFLDKKKWESILKDKMMLLVSNPPYIAKEDIKKLEPEIQFEPRLGQNGGKKGITVYKKLLAALKGMRGFLVMEIGQGQDVLLKEILQKKRYQNYNFFTDLHGITRVLVINNRNRFKV